MRVLRWLFGLCEECGGPKTAVTAIIKICIPCREKVYYDSLDK